jgi:hypothetical protein
MIYRLPKWPQKQNFYDEHIVCFNENQKTHLNDFVRVFLYYIIKKRHNILKKTYTKRVV